MLEIGILVSIFVTIGALFIFSLFFPIFFRSRLPLIFGNEQDIDIVDKYVSADENHRKQIQEKFKSVGPVFKVLDIILNPFRIDKKIDQEQLILGKN